MLSKMSDASSSSGRFFDEEAAPLLVALMPDKPVRLAGRDISDKRLGEYNIIRKSRSAKDYAIDLFGTILRMNDFGFFFLFFSSLALLHLAFAYPYYLIDGMKGYSFGLSGTFGNALAFSGSILSASSPFESAHGKWNKNWLVISLVILQSLLAVLWLVVVFGMVIIRLSNGFSRGRTVVFSEKALISEEPDGTVAFSFRLCESKRHQLVHAQLKCHFVDHLPVNSSQAITCEQMKIQNEGTDVFMGLPIIVKHIIDETSPLAPHNMRTARNVVHCDICGDTFIDYTALLKHRTYSGHIGPSGTNAVTLDAVSAGLEGRCFEIIVTIHGYDHISNASAQMMFSYFGKDECQVGGYFEPCVTFEKDNIPLVNFKDLSKMTY